ncbi:efflux RND transporter periplasmic adaptor subunit [Granulosicoccus antarcticus]|uniref:Multidrug resistance protein MdtA n=1 Tax=Granulosicoccus antarcticus IMCC3135 TaxID=1192854 RepID=A0A2Z2P0U5_9GAMM|nr:efflux RND transporter periplasmic adaptor subunit [Granulosicoccus antarcticus]ASJ76395.1 Multidrug resistance protein MdtA [Granulosicoccus antarcticus IMCC3135]
MIKRILFSLLGLVVIVFALAGTKVLQFKDMGAAGAAATMPPTAVTAIDVQAADWETTITAIGTLEAAQGVVITADLSGRVSELFFDGGERVEAGDVLVQQETSTEDAQLSAAESDMALAKSNLDRISRLYKSQVVSRSEYDAARSQSSAAQAQLDNITASLAKKKITAPFAGRLGLRLVDIGQDLSQGVGIVSLQAFDPMRVNFSLPQKALANVTDGLNVRVSTDAVPGRLFTGKITAINTEIDSSTRTVRTQATLNVKADDGSASPVLLPGMYANVEVVLPDTRAVLIVPLTSVSFATYGDSVFILEKNDNDELVANQKFVQLGERRGDFVEVKQGLEPGQSVANDGVFKLRTGAVVSVKEGGSEPSLAPQPDNS